MQIKKIGVQSHQILHFYDYTSVYISYLYLIRYGIFCGIGTSELITQSSWQRLAKLQELIACHCFCFLCDSHTEITGHSEFS